MTIDERIRYMNGKINNIIYYRLTIEEENWEWRFRCQYMHVLRDLRKQILELIEDMEPDDERKEFYGGIVNLISPKVKTDECLSTIKSIEAYVNEYK